MRKGSAPQRKKSKKNFQRKEIEGKKAGNHTPKTNSFYRKAKSAEGGKKT